MFGVRGRLAFDFLSNIGLDRAEHESGQRRRLYRGKRGIRERSVEEGGEGGSEGDGSVPDASRSTTAASGASASASAANPASRLALFVPTTGGGGDPASSWRPGVRGAPLASSVSTMSLQGSGKLEPTQAEPKQTLLILEGDVWKPIMANRSRVVFSTSTGGFLGAFSIIPYDAARQKREKPAVKDDAYGRLMENGSLYPDDLCQMMRKDGISHAELITPYTGAVFVGGESSMPYDALFLDDPELRAGKNKKVMNLAGYVASIVPFVKPKDLKEEMNQQYLQKHEYWIDPNLTLSKIRSMKRRLGEAADAAGLHLGTVAHAIVLFEKLVISKVITEDNRKLVGGVCLLLAAKFNEIKMVDYRTLLVAISKVMGIDKSLLLESEFAVYVDLGFSLHVPIDEVLAHYRRLTSQLDQPLEWDESVWFWHEPRAVPFEHSASA